MAIRDFLNVSLLQRPPFFSLPVEQSLNPYSEKTNSFSLIFQNSSQTSDLDHVRQFLKKNAFLTPQPYTARKRHIVRYKLIFLGFGLLFMFLGMVIMLKNPSWTCSQLFWSCNVGRYFMSACSFILSFVSLYTSYLLNASLEVINQILNRAKLRLSNIYRKKSAQYGWQKFLPFGESHEKIAELKHHYDDLLHLLGRYKEEELILMEKISIIPEISSTTKESLINQSLVEFRKKVDALLDDFAKS